MEKPFILNLTQHNATPDQVAAGVMEPQKKAEIQALLTFGELPDYGEITERARKLARIAKGAGATHALIGGAPYLMGALENALLAEGVAPMYAFSQRCCVETAHPDGTVTKSLVFKHQGFVTPHAETK